METIIDALMVLYDECCSSSFKREQTVVEFVENGKDMWGGVGDQYLVAFFAGHTCCW